MLGTGPSCKMPAPRWTTPTARSRARQSDIDLLLGAGANAFFKKPFDINLLVEKMANLVTA